MRQLQLSPEADPILDSVAAAFDGDPGLAVSELLIAHESIESFLDDVEIGVAAVRLTIYESRVVCRSVLRLSRTQDI